jgi:hypothetical protein
MNIPSSVNICVTEWCSRNRGGRCRNSLPIRGTGIKFSGGVTMCHWRVLRGVSGVGGIKQSKNNYIL